MADNLLDKASILLTPTAYNDGSMLSVKPENGDGDFTFSRGSAATRVNEQGLVENVQIISPELVSNGNFSQIGTEEVLNGNFSQEGSELVTNGDFATDSDWNKNANWSISGGTANCDGTSNNDINQGLNLFTPILGKTYKISIKINSISQGGIRVSLGGSVTNYYTAIGIYTYNLTTISTDRLRIQLQNSAIGSIDNVSVKEVGQNWSLGTGWSIGDDKAISDGTSSNLDQSGTFLSGKTYKVVYTIEDYVSGDTRFRFTGTSNENGILRSANGIYTEYITLTNNQSFLRFVGYGILSITNISVKEVGQDWSVYTSGTSTVTFEEGAVLNIDGSNSNIGVYQENVFSNGTNYKIVVNMKATASFNAEIVESQSASTVNIIGNVSLTTSYQEFTFYHQGAGTNDLFIHRLFSASGSNQKIYIKSASVVEITDDTDIPRIDYTDGCGNWLLEPQSTNLIPYSESFLGSTGQGNLTDSDAISPDGSINGFKISEVSTNSYQSRIYTNISYVSGISYTLCVFAKASTNDRFVLFGQTSSQPIVGYDLTNGTILTESNVTSSFIDNYGNGWYRCGFTYTSASTQTSQYGLNLIKSGTTNTYLYNGDTNKNILFYGAQLEQQSYPTSYIPTNGAIATRLADLATNSGNASLINSTEGVLYVEVAVFESDVQNTITINNGTTGKRIFMAFGVSNNEIACGDGVNVIRKTTSNIKEFNKVAFAWGSFGTKLFVNGVLEDIATSLPPFVANDLTQIDFMDADGNPVFYGKTKALAVYKEALTDAELQSLTTI